MTQFNIENKMSVEVLWLLHGYGLEKNVKGKLGQCKKYHDPPII